MPIASVPHLVLALREYRLLDVRQLEETTRLAGQMADVRSLARLLIDKGWLTAYQANQLLLGRGDNLVLGPYVLLERLGEGGMGAVFKARHTRLNRVVALKLIRKERLANRDAVRRFHREIRAVSALTHPNIVHAFDADQIGSVHFFAMEFVEGPDLAKLVKQRGPLSPVLAADCIRQAAMGLQHAFEHGLVHRDIKPHNLLIASYSPDSTASPGLVKILDLGLARAAPNARDESSTGLTSEGAVMGTVDYIAPEQARDPTTVDVRADLYSLGCTFYFLLTSRPPYSGNSAMEKLMKHQLDPVPSVQALRPDVPAGIAAVVARLMAKQPEDRFQTPAELVAALTSLHLDETPPVARPPDTLPEPVAGDTNDSATRTSPPPPAPAAVPSPTVRHSGVRRAAARGRRFKLVTAGAVTVAAVALLVGGVIWYAASGSAPRPVATGGELRQVQGKEADAEQAFAPLEARFADAASDGVALRQDLQNFLGKHSATPAATRAADLLGRVLARLPSPLDARDANQLPADVAGHWRLHGLTVPPELVAVLGRHGRRHAGPVVHVAATADGKRLASSDGKAIALWDAADPTARAILTGHRACTGFAFSATGRRLASVGSTDHSLRLWDAESGKETASTADLQACHAVCWTRDENRLLVGSGPSVLIVDAKTLAVTDRLEGFAKAVTAVAVSPDDEWVAAGANDGDVRVWNLARKGEPVVLSDAGKRTLPATVAFAGDHTRVVVQYSTGKASVWDLSGEKPVEKDVGVAGVRATAVAADGKRVALIGIDKGAVVAANVAPDGAVTVVPLAGLPSGKTSSAAFVGPSAVMIGTTDGTLRTWDADTGREAVTAATPLPPVECLAFSPESLFAGGADGGVVEWNLATLKEVRRSTRHRSAVSALAVSPDGKTVASAGADEKTAGVWEAGTGRDLFGVVGPINRVVDLSFSADGRYVLAGALDNSLRIWSVLKGTEYRCLVEGMGKPSARLGCFSPDGGSVTTCCRDEKSVVTYDLLKGGTRRLPIETGAADVAVTPDGLTLVFGSRDVWATTAAGPKKLVSAAGGSDLVAQGGLALTPDGRRFATVNGSAVSVWDTLSGRNVKAWQLPGPVADVAWAPDGRHLAVANASGTVYFFRVA